MIKSWYQKALFTLNMFPKNKQNKLRQKKNNEFKEEIYSNYTTIHNHNEICYFLILLYFIKYLLKIHQKMSLFCIYLVIYLVCLLQSYHKRGMGVYKVFSSNVMLFYNVSIGFIFDLRR